MQADSLLVVQPDHVVDRFDLSEVLVEVEHLRMQDLQLVSSALALGNCNTLTLVAMKFRSVLRMASASLKECGETKQNSLHEPRQFTAHGIEDLPLAPHVRHVPRRAADEDALQHALRSPNL